MMEVPAGTVTVSAAQADGALLVRGADGTIAPIRSGTVVLA